MAERQTRLRITSDGTPRGTRVFTEDGTLVRGVQLVAWHLSTGELARCTIEVRAVAVDLVGEGSMPEDPTAVVTLAQDQEAPEGPGFAPVAAGFQCPECAAQYDDPDEVCAGTAEEDHVPCRVTPCGVTLSRVTDADATDV
jgi:hypothetical protein